MQEAWRTYLGVALGLGETSRKRVRKVVKDAVGKGNATADQVKTMTGDLLAANSANREAMAKLVKFEVDRALGRVGLATAEEVRELTGRVHELERELRSAGGTPSATTSATTSAARKAPSRRSTKATKATEPSEATEAGPAAKKKARKASPTVTAATATGRRSTTANAAKPAKATESAPAKKADTTAPARTTATKKTVTAKAQS